MVGYPFTCPQGTNGNVGRSPAVGRIALCFILQKSYLQTLLAKRTILLTFRTGLCQPSGMCFPIKYEKKDKLEFMYFISNTWGNAEHACMNRLPNHRRHHQRPTLSSSHGARPPPTRAGLDSQVPTSRPRPPKGGMRHRRPRIGFPEQRQAAGTHAR